MPTSFTDYKISQFRSWFPHTEKQLVYLNHAAISPLSVQVVEAMELYIDGRHAGDIETFEDDLEVMQETRQLLAKLMNAESADRIAIKANTSDGIHTIVDNFPWKEGDEIILNSMEFPTNYYPFANQRKHGVKVVEVDASDGLVPLERIIESVTPRTRMISISAVQFLSGYKADLAAIGAYCREHDIVFVVDAIQALGASPIDVQAMNIDALAGGSHKWLMAPIGLGFLYLTEKMQSLLNEHYYGWLSVENPMNMLARDQKLSETASRYEGGVANIAAIHGLYASLTTLLEIGIEDISNHLAYLTSLFIDGVWDLPVELFTSKNADKRAGIVTIKLPEQADSDLVYRQLKSEQIVISVREGKLRVAPHFYNNAHEIMHLSNVLRYILGSNKT